jgi:hypothetical protein
LNRVIKAIAQTDLHELQIPELNKSESGLQYLLSYSQTEKNQEIEKDIVSIQKSILRKSKTISFVTKQNEIDKR